MKKKFFHNDEIAMQIIPAEKNYVNIHPYTLHLWRYGKQKASQEKELAEKARKALRYFSDFFQNDDNFEKCIDFENQKILAIKKDDWPSWAEIVAAKKRYWKNNEAAVQLNIFKDYDLNQNHIVLLWDAQNLLLPSKEFV